MKRRINFLKNEESKIKKRVFLTLSLVVINKIILVTPLMIIIETESIAIEKIIQEV